MDFEELVRAFDKTAIGFQDMAKALEQSFASIEQSFEYGDIQTTPQLINYTYSHDESTEVIGWLDENYIPRYEFCDKGSLLTRLYANDWPFRDPYALSETYVSQAERYLFQLTASISFGHSRATAKHPSMKYGPGKTVGTEYHHSLGRGAYVMTVVRAFDRIEAITL